MAKAERVVAGGKTIEVARVRITEAGRRVARGTLMVTPPSGDRFAQAVR
jgi:acyl-coenzyme A thioesterase PaaI-like protein